MACLHARLTPVQDFVPVTLAWLSSKQTPVWTKGKHNFHFLLLVFILFVSKKINRVVKIKTLLFDSHSGVCFFFMYNVILNDPIENGSYKKRVSESQ